MMSEKQDGNKIVAAEHSRPFRILSVDGGGYLGLAAAAAIRGWEQHFGLGFHERFDLFCGTSTGAIIAMALATGKSGQELVDLYGRLGQKVFRKGLFGEIGKKGRNLLLPKYGNEALREALHETFQQETFGDLLNTRKKYAIVTAYNITSGSPRVFKTDHSARLSLDASTTLADAILASTAAPTFFPVVAIRRTGQGYAEHFCDGGIVANHPALIGFAEALSELSQAPDNIRLLSVSTPRKSAGKGPGPDKDLNRGVFGWAFEIADIFIGSNVTIAHELLLRFVRSYPDPKPIYERIEMENTQLFAMDEVTQKSTRELERIGTQCGRSRDLRERVGRIVA
ncbi:MAG: patatin-like phospholipase family protein [Methylococcaceae bacterium]|nr:patatin-like phospholipase family protein [Methylococcaceae bacterium]MCI0733492.1 patatin-like phospholipase family protein [Methylococcaceae bacterium]